MQVSIHWQHTQLFAHTEQELLRALKKAEGASYRNSVASFQPLTVPPKKVQINKRRKTCGLICEQASQVPLLILVFHAGKKGSQKAGSREVPEYLP